MPDLSQQGMLPAKVAATVTGGTGVSTVIAGIRPEVIGVTAMIVGMATAIIGAIVTVLLYAKQNKKLDLEIKVLKKRLGE